MVKTLKRKRPNTPSNSCGSIGAVDATDLTPAVVTGHSLGTGFEPRRFTENVGHVIKNVSTPPSTSVEPASGNPEEPSPAMAVEDAAVKVKVPIFKNPNFVHSSKSGQTSKKSRVWKNLKQIIAAERAPSTSPNDITYASIDAPPSLFPAKKYSDLSGLAANYTDPQTKLRYASVEEFARIRMLPADVVAAYLAVRKASVPVP